MIRQALFLLFLLTSTLSAEKTRSGLSPEDQKKVEEYLPPHVQYACRYWVNHLQHCASLAEGLMSILAAKAYAFLKVHLLHWVEAMSLIGRFNEAIECVVQLELWFNDSGEGKVSTTKVCPFYHIKVATPGPQKF